MTSTLAARLSLAERYAELGLHTAATCVLERARSDFPDASAEVLDALVRVYTAIGDGRAARDSAALLAAVAPGPAARVRLGEAQLVDGELDAARFSFAAALEASAPDSPLTARALLGRAAVAAAEEDAGGAGAAAVSAIETLLAAARAGLDLAPLVPQIERAIEIATASGRGDDVVSLLAEIDGDVFPTPFPIAFLESLAFAASAHPDADVAAKLAEASASHPRFLPARVRLIEHRLRRRHRDAPARARALAELEALAAEISSGQVAASAGLVAAVQLSLATLYEDEPLDHDKAVEAYRYGLVLRPGHIAAATRLSELVSARGDRDAAIDSAAAALAIDGESHLGWLAAARACGAPGSVEASNLGRLLEASAPIAGRAAPQVVRLLAAAIEVARGDLLAGMHARGHRVKNLLGILGSRARRARKMAADEALAARLAELESEMTALYDEWSQYLRSMHAGGPTFEIVELGSLLEEVAAAARARGQIGVELDASRLPALRADRVLLGEALTNLAGNAVDACEGGGSLVIRATARGGAGAVVEITFADTGKGIGPSDLSRVLAPGFTTKESGSGLGLAIAERVIRAHRGRLLIDSELGRGTLVTVLLPTEPPSVVSAEASEVGR